MSPQVLPRVSASDDTTVIEQNSTANLGAAASVDLDNNIQFAPVLDIFAFMDQAGRVQIFASHDGVTFRQIDEFAVVASVPTTVADYRGPALHMRVRLINDAGGATTVLAFQVIARDR